MRGGPPGNRPETGYTRPVAARQRIDATPLGVVAPPPNAASRTLDSLGTSPAPQILSGQERGTLNEDAIAALTTPLLAVAQTLPTCGPYAVEGYGTHRTVGRVVIITVMLDPYALTEAERCRPR